MEWTYDSFRIALIRRYLLKRRREREFEAVNAKAVAVYTETVSKFKSALDDAEREYAQLADEASGIATLSPFKRGDFVRDGNREAPLYEVQRVFSYGTERIDAATILALSTTATDEQILASIPLDGPLLNLRLTARRVLKSGQLARNEAWLSPRSLTKLPETAHPSLGRRVRLRIRARLEGGQHE